jgi:hypothetical protein
LPSGCIQRKRTGEKNLCVLTWILAYLLVRYSLLRDEFPLADFSNAFVIGAIITALMFGIFFAMQARTMKQTT